MSIVVVVGIVDELAVMPKNYLPHIELSYQNLSSDITLGLHHYLLKCMVLRFVFRIIYGSHRLISKLYVNNTSSTPIFET
jgi:hypothetical protein